MFCKTAQCVMSDKSICLPLEAERGPIKGPFEIRMAYTASPIIAVFALGLLGYIFYYVTRKWKITGNRRVASLAMSTANKWLLLGGALCVSMVLKETYFLHLSRL